MKLRDFLKKHKDKFIVVSYKSKTKIDTVYGEFIEVFDDFIVIRDHESEDYAIIPIRRIISMFLCSKESMEEFNELEKERKKEDKEEEGKERKKVYYFG